MVHLLHGAAGSVPEAFRWQKTMIKEQEGLRLEMEMELELRSKRNGGDGGDGRDGGAK